MVYLLKVLSDIAQNPQPLSLSNMSKTQSQTQPYRFDLFGATKSFDLATGRNPRQFGHTDTDLDLTEMALQTLCCLLQLFRSHQNVQLVPPSLPDQRCV